MIAALAWVSENPDMDRKAKPGPKKIGEIAPISLSAMAKQAGVDKMTVLRALDVIDQKNEDDVERVRCGFSSICSSRDI